MVEIVLFSLKVLAMLVCLMFCVWGVLFNWWIIIRGLKGGSKNISPVFLAPIIFLFLAAVFCDSCFPNASWSKHVLVVLAGIDLVSEIFHLLYKDRNQATENRSLSVGFGEDENGRTR